MCASFLWKGKEGPVKGAKVKWKLLCHPKSEGGLGLKDILSWNEACILQNIWAIISKAGSIWIAWIQAYVLKGRDFWQVPVSRNSSWSWKKLMKLRAKAVELVKWRDGEARWEFSGNRYKAAEVWREIRPKMEKVSCHRLIWAKFVVPKHAFISWLAVLNRLSTKDRIKAWGMEVDDKCVMCRNAEETRDHVFFGCEFSRKI